MKRLYVGGLSHSITEKDLRDRFGKFGEVSGVEIITRKDEDGAPQKTFGYVNINISDADYKKCVTVLNKSKWKGGTLQIELAKESFLHRLAEERQQAAVKLQTPKIDAQQKMVESFKAAGVENFHMKAAVPGTEIPGHKNWVVSKFGRVLPVLHLKCQDKNKVLKYDPSKHCHNIKKLDAEDDFTPVSRLTWQIDGGDNEISKKRRGEFPPQKKPQSRLKPALDLSSVLYSTAASENRTRTRSGGDDLSVNPRRPGPVRVLDSDADSEDEIRMMVAQERFRHDKSASTEDDGNLEVVGDEFVVKNKFWGTEENGINEEEYDSADTDEILTQNKKPSKPEETDTGSAPKSTAKVKREKKSIRKDPTPPGTDSDDDSESLDSDYEAMMGNCRKLSISLADLQDLVENMNEEASESDDAKDESQDGPSKHKTTLETKKAPSKGDINPEGILASLFGADDEKEEISKVKKSTIPAFVGTKELFGSGVLPSEPGLKRGAEKVHCETTEAKRLKSSSKMLETQQEAASKKSVFKSKIEEQGELSDTTSSSNEIELGEEPKSNGVASKPDVTSSKKASNANSMHKGPASSPCSSLMDQEETVSSKKSSSSSSTSSEESATSDEDEDEDTISVHRVSGSSVSPAIQQNLLDPLKQQVDNQKRLAAVEQRQKEAEEQKRLIQGALSKVDLPNASKGKHIVFDSDDDGNGGPENPPSQNKSLFDDESDEGGSEEQGKNTEKEFRKPGGSKLFDSSEEEDDGMEEDRFKIKPQFEGKAGQKLMELQSRFGTDPRFQMDAKFLENEEEQDQDDGSVQSTGEQELVEEKKKNLEILQSVLNISLQPSDANKAATKGKTFRDVSALHYDPTSEAHTAFETKAETPKQESKAERRKKRKESEKLPEVSKEIFYDVTGDLKEAFGTVKETQPEKEEVTWDKEEEENLEETEDQDVNVVSFSANSETDRDVSAGFKFSFFGDDAVKQTSNPDEYKVETLKGAKVSWQVDPRFQDSSSDEEDKEETEEKEQEASASITTTEQMAPTKPYFFFFDGDIRLKEGPGMFYRREKLEDLREAWEERRETLRVEFRKKHKDAKKRHKATMKT